MTKLKVNEYDPDLLQE